MCLQNAQKGTLVLTQNGVSSKEPDRSCWAGPNRWYYRASIHLSLPMGCLTVPAHCTRLPIRPQTRPYHTATHVKEARIRRKAAYIHVNLCVLEASDEL